MCRCCWEETIEGLKDPSNGIYVDGTAGGAGTFLPDCKAASFEQGGRLIAIDKDPDASRQRPSGLRLIRQHRWSMGIF